MADQIFDYEKLDVYCLSIEYVGETFEVAATYPDFIGIPAINGYERHSRFGSTLPRETANEASRTDLDSSIFRALGIGMLGNSGRAIEFERDLESNERSDESQTETHRRDADPSGDTVGPCFRVADVL